MTVAHKKEIYPGQDMIKTDNYRARLYRSYIRLGHGTKSQMPQFSIDTRRRAFQRLIRDHFPPDRDAAIIDLGCGQGALIHIARTLGYRNFTGVDLSPVEVARAEELGIDGVSEGELMATLAACPDASLDAVVAFDVIEHFRKDDVLLFADHVCRVLRPGGRFIVHTCNAESPFANVGRYGDFTHEISFTRDSIRQVLLACGFRRVDCYEERPIPHGVKSSIRWLLWHVFRTGLRLYRAVETGTVGRDAIFSQDFLAVAAK